MITISDKTKCCGCHACASICPVQCIHMEYDSEGFLYPSTDSTQCLNCEKCESVCPILHPIPERSVRPQAWAAMNTNEQIRLGSSSGGMFTLLAESVLKNNGVVFGAAFTEAFDVAHIVVTNVVDLEKLRGSKYTQSTIGTIFQQVKVALNAGKQVLFSGTPCQIEGLHAYLGKEYDNLLLVDIICHGVPSPLVWRKYVQFQEMKYKNKAQRISFRHKHYGWKRYSVSFLFKNNTEYLMSLDKDIFMHAFLRDCCLRPSCGICVFKKIGRISDITLADFWGIQSVLPTMDDDKGTSLVLVHTSKGKHIFDKLSLSCRRDEVDMDTALMSNPAMYKSAIIHKNRDKFFENLEKLPFDTLVKKYATQKMNLRSYTVGILRHLGLLDAVRHLLGRR